MYLCPRMEYQTFPVSQGHRVDQLSAISQVLCIASSDSGAQRQSARRDTSMMGNTLCDKLGKDEKQQIGVPSSPKRLTRKGTNHDVVPEPALQAYAGSQTGPWTALMVRQARNDAPKHHSKLHAGFHTLG